MRDVKILLSLLYARSQCYHRQIGRFQQMRTCILNSGQSQYVTFFIISVRSPCASSSGVGGSGRFGGPGGNCGGVDGAESSDSTLNPGLYEIGLMHETKRNQKTDGGQEGR